MRIFFITFFKPFSALEARCGIPKSFQPEIIDRILIGQLLQHEKSVQKLCYIMENQFYLQNVPFKVDLLCEYITNDHRLDPGQ